MIQTCINALYDGPTHHISVDGDDDDDDDEMQRQGMKDRWMKEGTEERKDGLKKGLRKGERE